LPTWASLPPPIGSEISYSPLGTSTPLRLRANTRDAQERTVSGVITSTGLRPGTARAPHVRAVPFPPGEKRRLRQQVTSRLREKLLPAAHGVYGGPPGTPKPHAPYPKGVPAAVVIPGFPASNRVITTAQPCVFPLGAARATPAPSKPDAAINDPAIARHAFTFPMGPPSLPSVGGTQRRYYSNVALDNGAERSGRALRGRAHNDRVASGTRVLPVLHKRHSTRQRSERASGTT
jgi:hypothetical protein